MEAIRPIGPVYQPTNQHRRQQHAGRQHDKAGTDKRKSHGGRGDFWDAVTAALGRE
jgi:hypothetical protein